MSKKKVKRLHDTLYLKENRYKRPKESSKILYALIKKNLKKKDKQKLLDIGCATGEFVYFINSKFKNIDITGLDILPSLLKKAQIKNPGMKFLKKNIDSKKFFLKNKYDIITMNGVLSIFDNFERTLNNILKMMHENSCLFIHGHFNPYDYDVFVKYSDNKIPNLLQSGWNIFSLESIKKYCKKKKLKISIYPFNIKINLSSVKNDPVRTWTINVKKKKFFTNGLNLLLSKYFLVITKK